MGQAGARWGKRTAGAAAALAGLVVLGALLFWKEFAVRWHLGRLRGDPGYLLAVVEAPDDSLAHAALLRFFATEEGEKAVLELFLQETLREFIWLMNTDFVVTDLRAGPRGAKCTMRGPAAHAHGAVMLDWEEGLEQHRISRAGANRLGDLIAGLGGRTLRLTRFPGTRFEIRPHSEPGDYLEIHLRRELKAPLPFLVKKLKSPESSERVHAALDLAVAGDQASQAIPALIEALSDGDPEVSWAASYALGLQDEAAIPLLSVLESGDLRAREGAARSLQSLGKAAKPAIPALQALIDAPDTSSRLRLVAREALRVIYAGGR